MDKILLLDYVSRAILLGLISFIAVRYGILRNDTPVMGRLFFGLGTGFAFYTRRPVFLEECRYFYLSIYQ